MLKTNTKAKLFIASLMVMSFILCVLGLKFGLPSERQNKLVFSTPEEKKALIPLMLERRERIYKHYASRGVIHSLQNTVPECKEVTVNLAGRKIKVSERKIDVMRGFLLQSQIADESFVLKVISQIDWRKLNFNPRFFCYGGLYFYPVGAAYGICSLLGLVNINGSPQYYLENSKEVVKLFMVPKIFGALLFIVSIPMFFLVGKEFYNFKTSVVASALYSFSPITIVYSHFFKPHVAILPWVVLSMWAAGRLLYSDEKKWYILSAVFVGFAAGTFSFAGAVLLCVMGSHVVKCFSTPPEVSVKRCLSRFFNRNIFIFLTVTAMSFLIVNPYWVLAFKDITHEFTYLSRGLNIYAFSFSGLGKYLFTTLPAGVGRITGILFIGGLINALYRRTKADIILLFLIIPFIIYAASSAPGWWLLSCRLSMVIVPAVILLGSRFLTENFFNNKFRFPVMVATILIILFTFLNSLYYDMIFLSSDTKLKAGEWINKNIRKGSSIGVKKDARVPFHWLSYNTSEDSVMDSLPDYYVTDTTSLLYDQNFIPLIGDEKETRNSLFQKIYRVEKKFKRHSPVWDSVFKNSLMFFTDAEISIYRKTASSGRMED